MSKDNIVNELMRELILTISAWRRLRVNAERMRRDKDKGKSMAGLFILSGMYEAWAEAQNDIKESEKDLKKYMKEEVKSE